MQLRPEMISQQAKNRAAEVAIKAVKAISSDRDQLGSYSYSATDFSSGL